MFSRFVSGAFGLLLLVACGSQAPIHAANSIACSEVTAPHHAYVVVQHLSGASIERCVGFTSSSIDGQTVMDQSGIEYETQSVTSGKVVCQVDLEPRQYSQCFPQNHPYWALFIESGGHWSSAPGGYAEIQLHDTEALGWHYVNSGDPAPLPPPMPRQLAS
jgi:hypothetical protein